MGKFGRVSPKHPQLATLLTTAPFSHVSRPCGIQVFFLFARALLHLLRIQPFLELPRTPKQSKKSPDQHPRLVYPRSRRHRFARASLHGKFDVYSS